MTSVTFLGSVTSIGDHAFYHCDKLTTVNYYGTKIPTFTINTFSVCESLTAINVHENYEGNTFCGEPGTNTQASFSKSLQNPPN